MKKWVLTICFTLITLFISLMVTAQCSICTKTAQQLGEKPAKALNGGIIYLASAPLIIFAVIGYRWYKNNKQIEG